MIIPKIKPPNPNPQIITPLASPFLPGKWLHPAARADEYISPFPAPNPMEYSQINHVGFFTIEHIQTIPSEAKPPNIKVGFDPIC